MTQRIPSLDVIRGFALLGVLLVNAPYFAAPMPSVINPAYGPLAVSNEGLWSWFLPYVLFEHKSIALFSMLFGISLFLVGSEADRRASRVLRRRLTWLALFGIIHGVALWFGDILLSYALTGFLVLRARSWSPRALLLSGITLFILSLAALGAVAAALAVMPPAEQAASAAISWTPSASVLTDMIAAYQSGWGSAQSANFSLWIDTQLQLLILLTARTAGLMMIGLALFKSGFLSGGASVRQYRLWLGIGAFALALLTWNALDILQQSFPMVRAQALGLLITAGLAPLVALGYAAGLILLLRSGRLVTVTRALAATGRMAFTNYLVQSVVLSTLFWGGRGFGLYGELSRPAVIGIAIVLFLAQAAFSVLWLRHFGQGPLERLWRGLSKVRDKSSTPILGWTEPPLAIESVGLTKRYGRSVAAENVALAVPAGAIYGFLGPNGAGKTTTIRMLLGIMRPTAGSVRIFGYDVQEDRLGAARQVGALLEARATYDHMSGRDNLDMTRRLLGLPKAEVDRVLDVVDLRHAEAKKVGHYSLGMRQRLGLARALLGKPRLLLLDEPMNGLDPDGMADMRRTIRALPEAAGVTVFLSSHLLAEVEQVATHIGLMRSGRLVAQGRLDELLRRAAPGLFVRTGDLGRAHDLLLSRSIAVRRDGVGLTVIAGGSEADAAFIARMIVEAGIAVHEIAPRPADLEQLYRSWSAKEAA